MNVRWGPMELVETLIGHTASGAVCEVEKYQKPGQTGCGKSISGENAYRLHNGIMLERLEIDTEDTDHHLNFRNCVTGEIIYTGFVP